MDKLLGSPSLKGFHDNIKDCPSLLVEGLWDAPKAALISLIARATKKKVLVLSEGAREQKLLDDFSYFGLGHIDEFPSWETLPGEEIDPSLDIIGKRFEVLHRLATGEPLDVMVASLQAVLQRLPSPESLSPLCHAWKKGMTLSFRDLPQLLISLGYRRTAVVSDKGEFAVRGGIIDVFPVSSFDPYRIEFFDDIIDEIRTFDPVGQKSIEKVTKLYLFPSSEKDVLQKEKHPSLIFDYLGKDTLVIFDDLLALEDKYAALKGLPGAQSRFFCPFEEFLQRAQKYPCHYWAKEPLEELSEVAMTRRKGRAFYTGKDPFQPLRFEVFGNSIDTKRWSHPFIDIGEFFSLSTTHTAATGDEVLQAVSKLKTSGLDLHFLCNTESEEISLKARISKNHIELPKKTAFERGYLSSGLVVSDISLALLPMTELTGRLKVRRQKWRNTYHTPASEFHEINPSDVVVHFNHGIGKFLGIEKRDNHLGVPSEFLSIEYSDNSKLYVPVAQSHLVSRYIGASEEVPTLSTLGTKQWQRTKLTAEKAVIGYAQDLLRMQAERELRGGFVFPEDSLETEMFESDFPYVETDDQLQAIADIKKDMMSPKAMDRLVCGDVGYGKTEVAMRAAFKAVVDGKKQVAVLVPTTVLAMQHFETFRDRMANFPINVAQLSRFVSAKEIKETLKKLKSGEVDIVVGTHRLISKDVEFNNLGLIIIDEEQRFGVRAKEHLKALKVGVDCMTLSATPIPRTLYLSLIGARDISTINTPPQDRLPIKSVLSERDSSVIQNALLRELSRDGQAFFIHNRVESIFMVSDEIQKLLPQARIVVGHGQMSSDEIDSIFHAFKSGEADILVATTIVENGIDIPNANTILIDNADKFGMGDLYQLRGRVGRKDLPAYAYFLIPSRKQLSELSRKRLFAMLETSGGGGGMKIAMRDLEIRGAGETVGVRQSGHIAAVGFHLYCKLLKRTMDALRRNVAPTFTEVKMEFGFDAKLPDDYINEPSIRLEIYHRLGETGTDTEADAILAEIKDRFGPPPMPVLWLHHLTRLRIYASLHHFTLIKFDTFTLTAERETRKETIKKTLSLPKAKKPDEFEKQTKAALAEAFNLKH